MFNVNKIIVLLFFVFLSLSLFFLIKDFNTDESLKGYYNIYLYSFLILSLLFFIAIILNNKFKIYLLVIFCSLVSSLYLFEFYIFKKGDINFLKRDLDNWENKFYYLQKEIKKQDAYTAFSYEDDKIFSLSGLQNSKILMCNESGYWAKYYSDRYGFNNPDNVWERKNIDIVFIGDSFTKGECVNQGSEITSQLRKLQNLNIINLGWQGTGPLRQFATYREFIKDKQTKYIFWVYFEENDLDDLLRERNNKILMEYFNNASFNQNLMSADIKKKVFNLILNKHDEFMKKEFEINDNIKRYTNLINYIKLYKTRQIILGNLHKKFFENKNNLLIKNYKDENLDFYFKLFDKLSDELSKNTKIVLVYLPKEKYGFTSGFDRSSKIKKTILSELEKRNIDIIDIDTKIKDNFFNPGDLYPKQHVGMHFNEKGYKFVAEKINEYLIKDIKNNAN